MDVFRRVRFSSNTRHPWTDPKEFHLVRRTVTAPIDSRLVRPSGRRGDLRREDSSVETPMVSVPGSSDTGGRTGGWSETKMSVPDVEWTRRTVKVRGGVRGVLE